MSTSIGSYESRIFNKSFQLNEKQCKAVESFDEKYLAEEKIDMEKAVLEFQEDFMNLNLWEKFKDIFGLSNTADNQRSMIALYVMHRFFNTNSKTPLWLLSHALSEAGLIKPDEHYDIGVIYAATVKQLMDGNNGNARMINLQVEDDPSRESLRYKVTFSGNYSVFYSQIFSVPREASYHDVLLPTSDTTPQYILDFLKEQPKIDHKNIEMESFN